MSKKVFINKIPYEIDCDMGTQDVCWLAMAACYYHGQNSYPISRYLPCMAKNKEGEILHPKLVICKYDKKIGDEVYVKIRSKASDQFDGEMSKEEKTWYNQAFGVERFMMEAKIRLLPSNESKKDFTSFTLNAAFKIHSPIAMFFPHQQEILHIQMEELGARGKNELFQTVIQLPYGELEVLSLTCRDNNGKEREVNDARNRITVEKFPEPLLFNEREKLIRQKESMIKTKENSLRQNIKHIEEEKQSEELRKRALEEFLESLPFSLDEIFEYTNKEIQDSTKDLIAIFALLEKDEYMIFKKLYEIFMDYCKYYEDGRSEAIDIEALMSFFKNYFDYSREDLLSLVNDFQKFYISRVETIIEYNFLDFIYTLIYLMYNIQIYKMIIIENELLFIHKIHETKLEDPAFKSMFKDDFVSGILISNIDFLKRLFDSFSNKKFENYYEMSPNQFIAFAKELAMKKGYDYLAITEGLKFLDDCCFFDFMEKVISMANKSSNDPDLDLSMKLSNFIDSMISLWDETLNN